METFHNQLEKEKISEKVKYFTKLEKNFCRVYSLKTIYNNSPALVLVFCSHSAKPVYPNGTSQLHIFPFLLVRRHSATSLSTLLSKKWDFMDVMCTFLHGNDYKYLLIQNMSYFHKLCTFSISNTNIWFIITDRRVGTLITFSTFFGANKITRFTIQVVLSIKID